MPKYAFVCSGGGVPAIESIGGMMEALKIEHDIIPDKIWACSGGTISSALYLKGISLLEFFKDNKRTEELIRFRGLLSLLFSSYFYDISNIEKVLRNILGDDVVPNLIVNATDKKTRNTYYLDATVDSIIASMSIPEVFKSKRITGKGKIFDVSYKEPYSTRSVIYEDVELYNVECIDGGVYDNVPVPPNNDLNDFDKVFILLCSENKTEDFNSINKIRRSITNIFSAYERESIEIIRTYGLNGKFYVLRPPKIDSPLLKWSEDFKCYHNAYNYIKNIKF